MAKKSAGGLDAQGQRVQNLGTPAVATDAASKSYVDGLVVKANFAATVAPTVTNDSLQGYAVGSPWMIPGTGEMWRARSVTAGAARWIKIDFSDHPGYFAGRYYVPFGTGVAVAGAVLGTTTMHLGFGVIKERITISQLGARVLTAAAGNNFQLAIYAHNSATNGPGALVTSTGSGSTTTAAAVNVVLASNVTLDPSAYWFAIMCDSATATFYSHGGGGFGFAQLIGSTSAAIAGSTTSQPAGLTTASTFGTWPADLSAATFTEFSARGALVQFLVASVP